MSALITAAAAIVVIAAGLVIPPLITIPAGVILFAVGYPLLGGIFAVWCLAVLLQSAGTHHIVRDLTYPS